MAFTKAFQAELDRTTARMMDADCQSFRHNVDKHEDGRIVVGYYPTGLRAAVLYGANGHMIDNVPAAPWEASPWFKPYTA